MFTDKEKTNCIFCIDLAISQLKEKVGFYLESMVITEEYTDDLEKIDELKLLKTKIITSLEWGEND